MDLSDMKEIPGYEGRYSITKDGRVWSHQGFRKPEGWLTGGVTKDGYRYFCLTLNGKTYYPKASTLVLETFVGPRPEGHEADHRNNIRDDDRLSNLRWMTHQENVQRIWKQGRRSMRGEGNSNGFLTEDDVLLIRRTRIETGKSYTQLAEQFGLNKSHIASIITGRLWSHLALNGEVNV